MSDQEGIKVTISYGRNERGRTADISDGERHIVIFPTTTGGYEVDITSDSGGRPNFGDIQNGTRISGESEDFEEMAEMFGRRLGGRVESNMMFKDQEEATIKAMERMWGKLRGAEK
jgi:hypothetical protein